MLTPMCAPDWLIRLLSQLPQFDLPARASRPGSAPLTWCLTMVAGAELARRAGRRQQHLGDARVEAAACHDAGEPGHERIAAGHDARADHEHDERQQSGAHYRTSVTPSNMSGGRWMPARLDAVRALRPDARGAEPADDLAVLRDAHLLEHEDLLHGDHVTFHAGDLRDARHLARAVGHARLLHDDLDGRGNLLPHGLLGQVHVAHRDHRFDTREGVARRVGVNRGERTVVAGVHGLQHVERLFAAHLADDDAVGAHTEGVDRRAAAGGWRPFPRCSAAASPAGPRAPVQLQLRGVLDRRDAVAVGDEARHACSAASSCRRRCRR